MALIKSISGIRGTIGGSPGEGLTPPDVVRFAAGYAAWAMQVSKNKRLKIVVGRDARISGEMVSSLVITTLTAMGCDVVNAGLATTPTVEIAVVEENADGGIVITASHNPKQWNALKLLDANGEFLDAEEGAKVLELADSGNFTFAEVDDLGTVTEKDFTDIHVQKIAGLQLVDKAAIEAAGFLWRWMPSIRWVGLPCRLC